MITYVDTSTLIKLIIEEAGSGSAEQIWIASDGLVAVSLIEVEARAALSAALRATRLGPSQHRRAISALGALMDQLAIVAVTKEVVSTACDLAEVHSLRGYDAVHLAAALAVGCDVLTSADVALCEAARREGIAVANPIVA